MRLRVSPLCNKVHAKTVTRSVGAGSRAGIQAAPDRGGPCHQRRLELAVRQALGADLHAAALAYVCLLRAKTVNALSH